MCPTFPYSYSYSFVSVGRPPRRRRSAHPPPARGMARSLPSLAYLPISLDSLAAHA